MSRLHSTGIAALAFAALTASAQAQAPAQPPFATTKVDGTENVYIFRYGGHQSMFVVTPAGVIATDPIGLRRPAAQAYIEEIQKVTKAPIKYVIYSHSHFDHIAGGKPFKDVGARFVAHQNAKTRIQQVKDPDVVVPDEVVTGAKRNITLGGTTVELNYVGKNHSDSTLVIRLPKEKIIFTVDWIPLNGVQFRGMADNYLPDIEDSLKKVIAMDWDRMIPGHPGPGGRLGTKDDARTALSYLQDLSAAVKEAATQGKCYADAMRDIKLPKYESFGNYAANLPLNIERYCDYYNRGI
jgi:glyoxylase-like metal-dependent hydrolase (beta-lactamase superfamily II)